MAAEKRITKRQMKEDKFFSTTFKTTEYIRQNQNTFITVAIALVVIFAAVSLFRWNTSKKRNDASTIMSRAEMEMAMGQMDQYVTDLQNVVENYGGTVSARIACFTLANVFFNNKQYDKAEQYFRKILSDYSSDKMMAASAAAGLGDCLQLKNDFAGAAKMFQQAADLKTGDLWTPSYLLKAGQAFAKAGDKKSAQAAFDEIDKQYPNSQEATVARRSLAEITNH
jgi:TolA-binding protein